jgi:hypothetical protein
MSKKTTPASNRRRLQLTQAVRKHAKGARSEGLHPDRVKHAVQCGKALLELKELIGHGGWNRWLEAKCKINRMTANRYMRLASRAKRLTPHMTIREAYIATGVITPKRARSKR